jgi:hypothetical protein
MIYIALQRPGTSNQKVIIYCNFLVLQNTKF